MGMPVYANPTDLTEGQWLPEVPDNAAALLRAASALLRRATNAAIYPVDDEYRPTDPALIDGFRDIVCAQVAAWVGAGIDPVAVQTGAAGGVVASKGMGGKSISFAGADQAAAARVWAATHLGVEAQDILDGLPLTLTVQVIG
ncbi:hypothetical protein [Xylanimonas ulmi]|uniref:Head-to-tail adaptor n=1 Tax=Xylanimonas ulmi TaxID=228973 RepID=A0A4Q7M4X2_9MICO|nr:hypothetical protein [Xylanibacterium ulmi]RZS61682.1 hypothetical protein EV386_1992 [Xylanibacterium ulmi]